MSQQGGDMGQVSGRSVLQGAQPWGNHGCCAGKAAI